LIRFAFHLWCTICGAGTFYYRLLKQLSVPQNRFTEDGMLQVPLPNGDILNIPMAEAAAQAAGAARANGVHMAPQMRGMTKSHSSSSMIDVSRGP
jgi:hypothetical protein